MTDRERLMELIGCCRYWGSSAEIADHLLANGVIVLPCKVGDTVWDIQEFVDGTSRPEIYELRDDTITVGEDGWFIYDSCSIRHEDFGKTLFMTREEAEAALKGGK